MMGCSMSKGGYLWRRFRIAAYHLIRVDVDHGLILFVYGVVCEIGVVNGSGRQRRTGAVGYRCIHECRL